MWHARFKSSYSDHVLFIVGFLRLIYQLSFFFRMSLELVIDVVCSNVQYFCMVLVILFYVIGSFK